MFLPRHISFLFLAVISRSLTATEFDLSFLNQSFGDVAMDSKWITDGVPVGDHIVDVSMNGLINSSLKVRFLKHPTTKKVEPCFTSEQFRLLKILEPYTKQACYFARDISLDASSRYTANNSTVVLSVPDVYIFREISLLKTPVESWDYGITSLKLNYNGYVSHSTIVDTSGYLSANALLSMDKWRIKWGGSIYNDSHGDYGHGTSDLYSYRDINGGLNSRLSLGQIRTGSGSSFNSGIPILGASLETAHNMYNSYWFNYAPLIKGYAVTTATVTVYQGDSVLLSRVVSPGEFQIENLDVAGTGADLVLVIEESNGQTTRRTIPFTRLPSLLREGMSTYSFSIGKYRNDSLSIAPPLVNFDFEYGMNGYTPRASFTLSDNYYYAEIGNTVDLGRFGALSLDIGGSIANLSQHFELSKGFFIKGLYAKQIERTSTNLQLIGYQYRSADFLSFEDYVSKEDQYLKLNKNHNLLKLKNRLQFSINQPIGNVSLYGSYYYDEFHESSKGVSSIYASVNTNIGPINLGLNYTLSENLNSFRNDVTTSNYFGLHASMPLSAFLNSGTLGYSSNINVDGNMSNNVSMSTSNDGYNYGMSVGHSGTKNDYSFDSYVSTTTRYGNVSANYSHSQYQDKATMNASGGLLIYKDGIIPTTYLSETSAIVDLDGAENVMINGDKTLLSNRDGIAVIPFSRSYGTNHISFDGSHAPDVEFVNRDRKYIPAEGATSLIKVKVTNGKRILVKLIDDKNYFSLPVYDAATLKKVGLVGIDNTIYLSGIKPKVKNTFLVDDGKCTFSVFLDGSKILYLDSVLNEKCN